MRYLLLILVFFLNSLIYGQNVSMADSMILELNDTKSDTSRIRLMNKISDALKVENPALSMEYARKALAFSESKRFNYGYYEASMLIAENYYNQNALSKAFDYFHRALNSAEKTQDKHAIAKISNALGSISFEMNDLSKSLDYHYRSVKLYFELNNKEGLSETYSFIGKTYVKQGKYVQALNIFNKALYIDRKLNNKERAASNYGNVGNAMLKTKDRESKTFFSQQIALANQYHDTTNLAMGYMYMGKYYRTFLRPDSAAQCFNKSLKLFNAIEDYEQLSSVYKSLSETMASKQVFDTAYQYLNRHEAFRDSLKKEQMSKLIAQQQMQYEFNRQLEKQKQQYSKKNTVYLILAGFLILLLIFFTMYFYGLRKKIRLFNSEKSKLNYKIEAISKELERKKRENTTQAMYHIKKNENLTEITTRLKKARMYFNKQNQHFVTDIISDLEKCASDMVWEEFEKRFEEVYTGFYKKLNYRFPNLTNNDKRLCAFLRMDMTTKEIANITKQTTNSIEVGRTRLRKKLNLCNKDISISTFLTSL